MARKKLMSFLNFALYRIRAYFQKQLTRQNVKPYIVPTFTGLTYALLILVFAISSINAKNNLILIFTLFLFSLGVQAMVYTHRNILKLQLEFEKNQFFFANKDTALTLLLTNSSSYEIKNLTFEIQSQKKINEKSLIKNLDFKIPSFNSLDLSLKPLESLAVKLPVCFLNQGKYTAPLIKISSQYPSAFLSAWKYITQNEAFYVFPEPINRLSSVTQKLFSDFGDKELDIIKPWSFAGPLKDVNWKVSQRKQGQIHINEYQNKNNKTQKMVLAWQDTENLTTLQEKQQQMSYWINLAFKNFSDFEVNLPQGHYKVKAGHFQQLEKAYIALLQIGSNETIFKS